jgi:hypothetical protein
MKLDDINLNVSQPLEFRGSRIGAMELIGPRKSDRLRINIDNGSVLELDHAIDVSEMLEFPRIFVVEGELADTLVLLGGERAYWLTVAGKKTADLKLFRREADEEYWTTKIIERRGDLIFIYEAGVLILNSRLEATFHREKFYNDILVSVEDNTLKFVRDHDEVWFMQITGD